MPSSKKSISPAMRDVLKKKTFKPLSFPRDESCHDAAIEWWYFNGRLKTEKGEEFIFMYCLFKADPGRVKLPFLEMLPKKYFYFSHSLVSDINKKSLQSAIRPYCEIDKESFKKKYIFIKTEDGFLFGKSSRNKYFLKTPELDLILISKKKPLLVDGAGWMDLGAKDTYYYSLSRLEAEGKIKITGKESAVSGEVWLDRQWSDGGYHSEDKWTWFSIQLQNNLEILCFEYGDKKRTKSANVCFSNGRQFSTRKVEFKPLNKKWESPATKAVYELSWLIEIPELGLKIKTSPKNSNQEMIFGHINYWEGGVNAETEMNGQKVEGSGFMELVGVPMRKSLAKIYIEKARELINDPDLIKDYIEKGKKFVYGKLFRP